MEVATDAGHDPREVQVNGGNHKRRYGMRGERGGRGVARARTKGSFRGSGGTRRRPVPHGPGSAYGPRPLDEVLIPPVSVTRQPMAGGLGGMEADESREDDVPDMSTETERSFTLHVPAGGMESGEVDMMGASEFERARIDDIKDHEMGESD